MTEMKNITINIPEIYDKGIRYLKDKGVVESRSGAIREAIKRYLEKELTHPIHDL